MYSLLWVATPADWRVRTSDKTPHPYWEQLHTWIRCANQLHMVIIIYGPPGFLSKLPGIGAIITELGLNVRRLHLCHFGDKYNTARTLPSAAYLQIATTLHLPPEMGKCNCGRTAEHVLDWYGAEPERARWRRKILQNTAATLCDLLHSNRNTTTTAKETIEQQHQHHHQQADKRAI